jgi:hypothetical protein
MHNQQTENEFNNKSSALTELRAKLASSDKKYTQLLAKHELIQSTHVNVLANQSLTLKENEHLTKEIV